jgi:hypothetical protein
VADAIREAIHEDLRKFKYSIEEHYARLATERTSKGLTEAERESPFRVHSYAIPS